MKKVQAFFLTLLTLTLFTNIIAAQDLSEGKEIFNGRCTSCHTINDGQRVGPQLAGINERREDSWLISFIKNSQAMIEEGDELANELYQEYNKVVMPSHEDLDNNQIKNLLAYIKDQAEPAQASSSTSEGNDGQSGEQSETSSKKQFAHQPKVEDKNPHLLNPHSFDFLATFWMTFGLIFLAALGFIGIVLYYTS